MRVEAKEGERQMPMTFNRAATAVVQCRSHVEKGRDQMRLALEILSGLDEPAAPWPRDPAERTERLLSLQVLLVQLEQACQELLVAAAPDGSVVARGDGHEPSGP